MPEIKNQENSEYRHFLGSVTHLVSRFVCKAEVKVDAISNLWLGYEKLVGQRRILESCQTSKMERFAKIAAFSR